jgi:acyl-CoA hydrolase
MNMTTNDWQDQYPDRIASAREAIKKIGVGNSIFIGTGCAEPEYLVNALATHGDHIYDAHIIHMLTMGTAPYADPKLAERFKMNTFFVAENVRDALAHGIGDYTPIFLSKFPGSSKTAASRSTWR